MGISRLAEWFIPAELRAIREDAGWSRRRLGMALKMHENTIFHWENADPIPKPTWVAGICKVLGTDPKRAAFLEHVTEQYTESRIVSDLNKRNIYIIERAELHYGEIFKWDPQFIPTMLQTEAYEMDLLPKPFDGPASQIEILRRKLRRRNAYIGRTDSPTTKILTGAGAIALLDGLTPAKRDEQLKLLLDMNELPNWEIKVFKGFQPVTLHGFDLFHPGDSSVAGPSFAYVETLDQSRHIEEPENLALYDESSNGMWNAADTIGDFLNG